jgi:hypothetical protein
MKPGRTELCAGRYGMGCGCDQDAALQRERSAARATLLAAANVGGREAVMCLPSSLETTQIYSDADLAGRRQLHLPNTVGRSNER